MDPATSESTDSDDGPSDGGGYKVDVETFPCDLTARESESPEPNHPRLLGHRLIRSTHALSRSLKQVLPSSRPVSRVGVHGEEGDDEDHVARRRSAFFVDVDAMKAKVKANLSVPKTSTVDLYKTEGWEQRVARSVVFDRLTLLVIACNAAWITVDTDYNEADLLTDAHPAFQTVEHCFCFYFVAEIFIRFLAFNRKRDCLKDTWFMFDGLLACMMVLETWVMTAAVVVFGGSGGSLGETPVLKIARLLRLSRMCRVVRLLRAFPELMIMVKGMLAAMRSVFLTLALLLIIMYVFGIAFTQLTTDTSIGEEFFSSVSVSMYTLALYGTLLDNVRHLTDSLSSESFALTALFFVFILLAAFTVMNMLIGVLCEVVSAVAATEREEFLLNYVKGKMMNIVEQLDTDGDRRISKTEFAGILANAQACRALRDVGVDVMALVDCAENIFLDSTGTRIDSLSFPDFMDVVLQLRGSNTATVKDVMELRKLIRGMGTETTHMLAKLNKRIRSGDLLAHPSASSSSAALAPASHARSSWSHPERSAHLDDEQSDDEEGDLCLRGPPVKQRSKLKHRPAEQLNLEGRWHPFGAEPPSPSGSFRQAGRAEGPPPGGYRPGAGKAACPGALRHGGAVEAAADGAIGAVRADMAELQTQLDGLSKVLAAGLDEVARLRGQLLERRGSERERHGSEAKISGLGTEPAPATGLDIASCVSFKVGRGSSCSEPSNAAGIDVAHTVSFKAWPP